MITCSAPDLHQGTPYSAQKQRSLATPRGSAPVIKTIREPLQNTTPVSGRQRLDQVQHHDGQRIGQPVGRQYGRRARYRLGGRRGDAS